MKKIFGLFISSMIAVNMLAVPAQPGPIVMTAADGTEKIVYLHGDETFRYMTDEQGNWIDEATFAPMGEEMKALRIAAGKERQRIQEERYAAKMQARRAKQETGIDRLLAPRGAVILVSYADQAFGQTKDAMIDWAMGDNYTYNGATGSIRQYFHDQSWGQYEMEIDVVGPVVVSHDAKYYGANDAGGSDKRADDLVVEACKLAHDSLGLDFSKYDFNNDGEVDWVVIIYAGKGEADGGGANTIWPHQYDLELSGKEFDLDGKTVNHYCCLNELKGTKRCGIGTFCHEFSHVLGLPDFYATNDATHRTLSTWDIMDAGPYNNNSNTPPNYSAYERWFMGWFKPRLINTDCSVILPPLHNYQSACFMNAQGKDIEDILEPGSTPFYIFENRQQEGWDYYLAGEGLMITKISWSEYKWRMNTVNNNAGAMGVDIIEATTNTSRYYDQITDLYPDGATEFTQIIQYQVSNIVLANRIITFDVNGGGSQINLDVENIQHSDDRMQKIIEDGRVVIVRDGQKFDVLGNRL